MANSKVGNHNALPFSLEKKKSLHYLSHKQALSTQKSKLDCCSFHETQSSSVYNEVVPKGEANVEPTNEASVKNEEPGAGTFRLSETQ